MEGRERGYVLRPKKQNRATNHTIITERIWKGQAKIVLDDTARIRWLLVGPMEAAVASRGRDEDYRRAAIPIGLSSFFTNPTGSICLGDI